MAPSTATVHRFQGSLFPVNAYLVETPSAVIVVDATLGVSDARRLRRKPTPPANRSPASS